MVQRSFLRWLGGKHRLVNQLTSHFPDATRFIEPFVGAGNVFINTHYSEYLLADINPDVINVYQVLRMDARRLVDRLVDIFSGDLDYYEMRDQFNYEDMNAIERAAYFIYLNRYGFNGVCRYNKNGKFNVPKGDIKGYLPLNEINAFIDKLATCKIALRTNDFENTINIARNGDVIYCDPPYLPASNTANFTGYHSSGFDYLKHEQLARSLYKAVLRGATAIVSNSNTKDSRYLFRDFEIHEVTTTRSCAAKSKSRGIVKEIICVLTPDMLRNQR